MLNLSNAGLHEMKTFLKEVSIRTGGRVEFRDITREVEEAVRESGIKSGVAIIFTPHTTTGIFMNEDESGLKRDLEKVLERLIPERGGYMHDEVDYNAYAHLRSILLGASLIVPVENGRLMLGTWQSIFLAEFDGPRSRRVYVRIMGSD
jgi:secondary thiamine-phosphate synthase enzyme